MGVGGASGLRICKARRLASVNKVGLRMREKEGLLLS